MLKNDIVLYDDEYLQELARTDVVDFYFEYEELKENLEKLDKETNSEFYIIVANLGLWNGTKNGIKVVQKLSDVLYYTEDFNKFTLTKNGTLTLDALHHDGYNSFTVIPLSKKGCNFWNNNLYSAKTDKYIYDKLLNKKYYTKKFANIWRA